MGCFCWAMSMQAQSDEVVLHECNFNEGIPTDYATYDLDGQTHHYTMVQSGLDTGNPWTALRERGNATNFFAAGTSKYKVAKGEEAQPANDWLVTPGMRVLTAEAKISWRAQSLCENTMKGDTYEIRVSTTGNRPEDFVDAPILTIETENINQWTERSADLGKYAGQYIYIAFVNRTHMGEILAIDDVRVTCSQGAYEVVNVMGSHVFGQEKHRLAGILRLHQLDKVQNFTASCRVGNQEYRRHFTGVDVRRGEDFRFEFEEEIPVAYGDTLHYRMWVDVEGHLPDTLDAHFVSMLFNAKRRTVFEEGTGMWCGYCPLGIIAIERMKQKYPDEFIPIAVHYDDPLEVDDYSREIYFTEFPIAWVNRKYEALPMVNTEKGYTLLEGGFETALLEQQAQQTYAEIIPKASIQGQEVKVDVTTRFAVRCSQTEHRLAFILVEDKVEGTGFYQTNYLSGKTGQDLDGFENEPDRIVPFVFNEVARSAAGDYKGIKASAMTKVEAGKEYHFTHTFQAKNLNNPANARVVVLLIDYETGHVVNAVQTASLVTGVGTVIREDAQASQVVYDVWGRKVSHPKKGMYIINGKKMFVR